MLNIHTCHWWDMLVGCDSIWNKPLSDSIPEDQAAEAKIAGWLQMKITGCQCLNGNLRRAIWCSASWRKKGSGMWGGEREMETEKTQLRPIAAMKSRFSRCSLFHIVLLSSTGAWQCYLLSSLFLALSLPLCHPSLAFFINPSLRCEATKECQSKSLVINLSWLKGGNIIPV